MIAQYIHIQDAGSCNFCRKGELDVKTGGLKYPYSHVYVLQGKGCVLSVNICRKCVNKLKEIL